MILQILALLCQETLASNNALEKNSSSLKK